MDKQTTVSLVRHAQQGDAGAFSALFDESKNNVYYLGYQMLGNSADAEDLVQEVFVTVYQKLESLQQPEAFFGWLKQIAANQCKNQLLKKKPVLFAQAEEDTPFPEPEEPGAEYLPQSAAEQKHVEAEVMRLIRALPDEQRMVVLLYYYQGMKTAEIARALGVSEGTVKSRLNYARKHLKLSLETEAKKDNKLYSLSAPLLLLLLERDATAYTSTLPVENILAAARQAAPAVPQAAQPPQPAGGADGMATAAASAGKAGISVGAKIAIAVLCAVLAVGAGVGIGLAVLNSSSPAVGISSTPAMLGSQPTSTSASEADVPLLGATLAEVSQALAGNWVSDTLVLPERRAHESHIYLSFGREDQANALRIGHTGYALGSGVILRSSMYLSGWNEDGSLSALLSPWKESGASSFPDEETLVLDLSRVEEGVLTVVQSSIDGLEGTYTATSTAVNGPISEEEKTALILSIQGTWRQEAYYTNPDPTLSFSQGYPQMLVGKEGLPFDDILFGLASPTATGSYGGSITNVYWCSGGTYLIQFDVSWDGPANIESFFIDLSRLDEGMLAVDSARGRESFSGEYVYLGEAVDEVYVYTE